MTINGVKIRMNEIKAKQLSQELSIEDLREFAWLHMCLIKMRLDKNSGLGYNKP